MPDHGNGMLLIVIRGQPVIFRADESFEERPGFSGKLPEKEGLVSRQSCSGTSERPADPPGDSGGEKPEAQDGSSHAERRRSRKRQINHRDNGDDRGNPHRPAGGDEVPAAMAIRVARRIPLQKSFVCDPHSPGRAHDRIETEKGLVGKTGERKCRLSHASAGRPHRGGEMLAQQHLVRLLKEIQKRGNPGGNQKGSDHRQGP